MRKILIIEANPQSNLKLNDEIQNLQDVILQSKSSGNQEFEIKFHLSTRSTDLQRIILKHKPDIIHFCGHGTGEKGLVFRDGQISTGALSNLFALFTEHLKCVVLNACYSAIQAEEIVQHINYVIGMNQAIQDDAAISFSTGFYQALAYGRTYEDAFKFGCNAIQLKLVEPSTNREQLKAETRKLVPIDYDQAVTITAEHQKPTLKINKDSILAATTSKVAANNIRHNLPSRGYENFVGRKEELKNLLTQVSLGYRQFINIVHGIGGVGKTALAVEVAYLLLSRKAKEVVPNCEIEEFEAIVFVSAKENYLAPTGMVDIPIRQQTLQEIFKTISQVLEKPYIARESKEKQPSLVNKVLEKQKTLLIIDNLETISDEELEEIFGFLNCLPTTTQAILTTREREGHFQQIELTELSRQDSLDLIQQEAENKEIQITPDEEEQFYEFFGGIPVALIYAVGQKAIGYSTDKIIGALDPSEPNLPEDLAQFIFENSVTPLRDRPAHKLLMAMTLFLSPPPRETLAYIAGLSTERKKQEDGLFTLQKLSLLTEEKERYKILHLTRQFALDEIAKYPDFKMLAQDRLIKFYLQFTHKYGGKDWQDWFISYDYLEQEWENIQFVLSLCASLDNYKKVKQIWLNIDHFVDLSSLWQARLQWWQWLADQADRRPDEITTRVKAKSEIAWTLILMKSPENKQQAEECLQEAWGLREFVNCDTQAHIANHIAVYRKTEGQYEEAFQWLNTQDNLVDRSDLPEKEKNRHRACIQYYRAEIYYLQNDFAQAKQNFESVINIGTQISWQRFTNYAQNNLVDILIEENDLSTVERRLTLGLYWAERSKEKRRIAHWQASYARYEQAIKNSLKAKGWAQKALTIFQQECMRENIQKMELLLDSLE